MVIMVFDFSVSDIFSLGPLLLFIIPTFILITIPIRLVVKKTNCVIPQPFIIFLIAMIIGLLVCKFSHETNELNAVKTIFLLDMYVPAYVFATLYVIDYFTLMMCFVQIVILSLMGTILNMFILGIIMKATLHNFWSYTLTYLAGLVCIPIETKYIITGFQELTKYKYLATIVEGEGLLTSILVVMLFRFGLEYANGEFSNIYHEICIGVLSILPGVIYGCIAGKITNVLICLVYNEPLSVLCISFSMVYFIYFTAEYMYMGMGVISVMCLSYLVAIDKYKLTTETDNALERFWSTLYYTTGICGIVFSTIDIIRHFLFYFTINNTFGILITYFSVTISRIVGFILMGFILNKLSYKINLKCLIIFGWGGVKGSLNFILILLLMRIPNKADQFIMEFIVYIGLSLLINGSSMRLALQLIGLTDMTGSRKANMNKCMNVILEKKKVMINLLKYNRHLSNSYWTFVRNKTAIKHPLKIKMFYENESDNDNILWKMNSICPDCFREIPVNITAQELDEILKLTHIEILKSKQLLVIKQYENGMISKKCWQVLKHSFEFMIELNKGDNVVDINSYLRKQRLLDLSKRILRVVIKPKYITPPTTPFKRLCFYTVLHVSYDYIMFSFIVLCSAILIWDYFVHNIIYLFVIMNIFIGIFIVDIIIKLIAFSKVGICHSFKVYVRFPCYIFDFIILILRITDAIITLAFWNRLYIIQLILRTICLLHLLRIFCLLKCIYVKILKSLEYMADSRICIGYDLATILVNCCDEILDTISQIVEMKIIRDIQIKKLQEEKNSLIKYIEFIQKERPWIAITVKTKQAIRTTINTMHDILKELKSSGFVDNAEFSTILKEIIKKQKFLRNMKFVDSSSPKVLFVEVPWMANDQYIIDFLFKNVQMVKWNTGDIICKEDKPSGGIYIIITGILQLYYEPKEYTLERLHKFGNIPIVDYLSTVNFVNYVNDTITPGNSIGELSVLTGRPYDCNIVADCPGEAYFLESDVIKRAIRWSADIVNGLESRMWKCSTINLVIAILMELPTYQSLTQEQIKFKLEKAFIPNLRCYKMFVVTEMIDDIVLIEGIAADFNTSEIYNAPFVIPKTVQKIILPRSSYLALGDVVQTKLLIIPLGQSTEYQIMEYEEEIAEMVSVLSSEFILHKPKHKSNIVVRKSARYSKYYDYEGLDSISVKKKSEDED